MEQEHFKRKSLTKMDTKLKKRMEREQLQEKIDSLDDMRGIVEFTKGMGKQSKGKKGDNDGNDDVLRIPKEFLK